MRTFSILTLGCKVNSYESEALINKLIDKGYLLKNFNEVENPIAVKQACAAIGQARLMMTYQKIFGEYNHLLGVCSSAFILMCKEPPAGDI